MAAVIVGGMIISLYACFSSGFAAMQATRENLRSTQIMLQRLEAVRLFTWKQVQDTNNYLKPIFTDSYDPLGRTNNTAGTAYTGFVSNSIPADVPGDYRNNMRTITLTVYWTNYSGNKQIVQSRQMETRVARYGMQNYVWGASQ